MSAGIMARMTMRAHVERNTAAANRDAWNTPTAPAWRAQRDPVPCYAWTVIGESSRQEADANKTVVLEQFRVMTPLDADLTKEDRISKITDRRGRTLFPGPIVLDAALRMPTHLEWRSGTGRPE